MKVILEVEESHSPFFMELISSLDYINIIEQVKDAAPKQKLSDRFEGRLNLTDEQFKKFDQYLTDSRNEWERAVTASTHDILH